LNEEPFVLGYPLLDCYFRY